MRQNPSNLGDIELQETILAVNRVERNKRFVTESKS